MNEQILLGIFALAIALILYFGRKYINANRQPLSSRAEAWIRFAMMVIAAAVAHAFYFTRSNPYWFVATVCVNAFFLYGATHFFDRVLTRGRL